MQEVTLVTKTIKQWPYLSALHIFVICSINIGCVFLAWIVLRVIWKPKAPTVDEEKEEEKQDLPLETSLLKQKQSDDNKPIRELLPGEVGGDYSENWIYTFDFVFLIGTIISFGALTVTTIFISIDILYKWRFWIGLCVTVICLGTILFAGGLVCRHYCERDEHGYIITNRHSHFKVNYTKKVHHLGFFLIPLVITKLEARSEGTVDVTPSAKNLILLWHFSAATIVLLLLIKPLRERITPLMIAFNAIDRPEDRPHTILWAVFNMPAALITICFQWLYTYNGLNTDLVYIFTFVNVVGDGLAEPVGIYFGKHRYKVRGCFNRTKYERSYEGSSCVLITTVAVTSCFYYTFKSALQFYLTFLILPLLMAITEAASPHTCDAAFLHFVGGLVLFIMTRI